MGENKRKAHDSNAIKAEREHNRYKIDTVGKVKKTGYLNWTEVRVVTLGANGACFHSIEFAPGDTIEFLMPAPGGQGKTFHLSARVVWIRDGQVGVEFTGTL